MLSLLKSIPTRILDFLKAKWLPIAIAVASFAAGAFLF